MPRDRFHIMGDVQESEGEDPTRIPFTQPLSTFAGQYGTWLSTQTIQNRLHTAISSLIRLEIAVKAYETGLLFQTRLHRCLQHVH